MKINKTLTVLIAGASLGLSGQAFSAATPAGESISNTVTLGYSVGGEIQNNLTDNADFIVDNKIDMTFITALTGTSTVFPGQNITPSYTLKNEGNESQSFKIGMIEKDAKFLAPTLALTLDGAADASCSVGGTGGNKTITMDPDKTCIFTADFQFPKDDGAAPNPIDIVNGNTFALRATATAVTDAAGATNSSTSSENKNDALNLNVKTLIVLAEEDTTVSGIHTAYDGAIIVDTGTITVATADFSGANGLKLTALVVNDIICDATYDPASNSGKYTAGSGVLTCDDTGYTPKAIPGALIEYTLTATNESATVKATAVEFKETLASMTYGTGPTVEAFQTGSLGNLNVSFSDSVNFTPDTSGTNGTNLSVIIAEFEAGENITIKFTAVLN